ncbi:MAG: cupin domain-containing protein [Treponema sp.]|jgi:mannose-6-phosphate isomerase-like protein (cupin superfamily)|nr:cupin domain-containing protein [Treponema sp.]
MVYHSGEQKNENRENARGGSGVINFHHFVEGQGKTQSNTNLLARLTLPPGASIGYHCHTGETEFFLFLEGRGLVSDDGVEKAVGPGDVMVTGGGASHSVTNNGSSPLCLIAVIIKD